MARYRFAKPHVQPFVGCQVAWSTQERTYLADVIGVYERDGVKMLQVRHFNGEPIADIEASAVQPLVRTW
jgi:hypothetical protein